MHLTHQLFNPEEAFIRLGQTRQAGCLVIVNPQQSIHLFVENGAVVNAFTADVVGQKALERALSLESASYMWIPDAKATQKTINVNITAFSLKNAIAKDIHIAATGKVLLPPVDESVSQPIKNKRFKHYYLLAEDRPNEQLPLLNSPTVLGRDASCDIVLGHIDVSRRHCLIQLGNRGISYRDLASTNGTKLNGSPLLQGVLTPGDSLHLGSYKLTFHRDE
jgi:hypothetical protein